MQQNIKAKIAAIVIILFAVSLYLGTLHIQLVKHDFNVFSIPMDALIIVAPAVGVYRRINWCRIYTGVVFAFCLLVTLILPFNGPFYFHWGYLLFVAVPGIPVFLTFFYPPLIQYTKANMGKTP